MEEFLKQQGSCRIILEFSPMFYDRINVKLKKEFVDFLQEHRFNVYSIESGRSMTFEELENEQSQINILLSR